MPDLNKLLKPLREKRVFNPLFFCQKMSLLIESSRAGSAGAGRSVVSVYASKAYIISPVSRAFSLTRN